MKSSNTASAHAIPGTRPVTDRRVGMRGFLLALTICIAGCGAREPAVDSASKRPAVEVMHWLTSDREAVALSLLRDGVIDRGGIWVDAPMPGAGAIGRNAVVSRIIGGNPPDAFQFSLGAALDELVAQNLVAPVPSGGDASLPPIVLRAASNGGRQIAIPVVIRGGNWLFYNEAVLRDAGVAAPRTWPEFMSAAAKLKASGKIPLALGGQPWQERLLFNAVLLGTGGRDFYRQVYEQLDPAAIRSPTMLRTYETFSALRDYVDQNSPGRRWNQATNLLVRGEAAFLIMGDWAKSEMVAAGLTPGQEIGCALTPAEHGAYIIMIDAFAFSPTTSPTVSAGQALFAQTLRDPAVYVPLAQKMGALPANLAVPETGFDRCSAMALRVLQDPQCHLLDSSMSLPAGLAGAIDDSVSRFWNDRTMSPQQGQALLADTMLSTR
jgi:glucose/mannose transport system substrate-binding protein